MNKKFNILLVGDTCIDEYQYGTVNRISPEAPVPIFNYSHTEIKLGMASNVKENLSALGCQVQFYTGKQSKKIRIIDSRTNQHLVRIDHDTISKPLKISKIKQINDYDCIIISDYNKGTVDEQLITDIRQEYNGTIFLDTKKNDLSKFQNIYIKINEQEYRNSISQNNHLIVTLGKHGAMYNNKVFPTTSSVDVIDVTGAGDTFLSALAYQFLYTNNIEHAIEFANRASSITVQHLGVYAPTLDEI